VIPDFTLPRCDGGAAFNLRSLKPRRAVVLLFAHTLACPSCRETAGLFAWQCEGMREHNAELVIILRDAPGEIPPPWPGIAVLCDEDGAVTRRYLRAAGPEQDADTEMGVGLFIADRWQALREWWVAHDEAQLPRTDKVVQILAGIAAECPECAPVASGWGPDQ
jgi:hypothetical protein